MISIAISNLNQIAITTEQGIAEVSDTAPDSDPTRVFSEVTAFGSAQQQVNGINDAHHIVGFFNDAPKLMGGPPAGGDGGEDSFVTYVIGATTFPTMILVDPGATLTRGRRAMKRKPTGSTTRASSWAPSGADGRFHGFIESGGVYTTLDVPGADDTFVQGINDKGDVTGYFEDASGVHGFGDSGGVLTILNVPGANTGTSLGTFAEEINDMGEVVGYFDDSLGHPHGFVESDGIYTTFDVPDANAGTTEAFGINDAGDIVGTYELTEVVGGVAGSTITDGFFATPLSVAVPEPPARTMMLVGLAGLGFVRRRVPARSERGNFSPPRPPTLIVTCLRKGL